MHASPRTPNFRSYLGGFVVLSLFFLITPLPVRANSSQIWVETFAGLGTRSLVEGWRLEAGFSKPTATVFDSQGNLFHTDSRNHRIRKMTPDGIFSTFAGSTAGFADGTGSDARFNYPFGMAIDAEDNLYVADDLNGRIRKVTPEAEVSTVSGTTGYGRLFSVAIDQDGVIYFASFSNSNLYKRLPDGTTSVLASGLNGPHGLAIDTDKNIYVAATGGNQIKKVSPSGDITILAGSGVSGHADGMGTEAQFTAPTSLVLDQSNNLFVTEIGRYIRKITSQGEVTTIAGTGTVGHTDGDGNIAQFSNLMYGIGIDKTGSLYIGDSDGNYIRKITFAPTIISITPDSISESSEITLSGHYFVPESTVMIDDILATDVVVNATGTELTATLPSLTAGSYSVTVTNPSTLQFASLPNAFTYTPSSPDVEPTIIPAPESTSSGTPPVLSLTSFGTVSFKSGITNWYYTGRRPIFKGVATPGTTVRVEIHSDPIVCTTTADTQGNWSCTPPTDIPDGNHEVLITATSPQGATTTLKFNLGINVGLAATGESTLPLQVAGLFLSLLSTAIILTNSHLRKIAKKTTTYSK